MGASLHLIAALQEGCVRVDSDDGEHFELSHSLAGRRVHCLAVDPGQPRRMYAGTWDDGAHHSGDGGVTWTPVGAGIAESRVISIAVSRASGFVYAGTEPSNLYVSQDGGESWRCLPTLRELPSAGGWFYPPRPGGHRVRSIVPHDSDPELLFAGIEVGGVMCSRDGGSTWEDHHHGAYTDSHALATHPLAPDRVYQAAAGGAARSEDRGASWRPCDDGLDRLFLWAQAIDPADPGLWYVSSSKSPRHAHGGPGRAHAAIYRHRDGERWRALDAPGARDNMPFALMTLRDRPDALLAGLDDGALLLSEDAGESWRRLSLRLPGVRVLSESS